MDELTGGQDGPGEADGAVNRFAERAFENAIRSTLPEARVLAEAFHSHYERLAPVFSYETREESRTEWVDVPLNNRGLMVFTAQAVIEQFGLEGKIEVPEAPS
jgi:hypothetical protein